KEIVTEVVDARQYLIADEVSFVYFQNSFGAHVLRDFLMNLKRSFTRTPRQLTFICNLPIGEAAFDALLCEQNWLIQSTSMLLPVERPRPKILFFDGKLDAVCEAVPNESPEAITRARASGHAAH